MFFHRWLYPRTNFYLPYIFFFAIFLGLTWSKFTTQYLVQGCPICNISMCYHPIITLRNFINIDPCKYFLNKPANICYVLQYAIDVLLLSAQTFTKRTLSRCLEFPVHDLFPFLSIFIAHWVSWNNMFCLISYYWNNINRCIQIFLGTQLLTPATSSSLELIALNVCLLKFKCRSP